YNGLHYKEFYDVKGLTQLGIEQARPRGICLDIARLLETEMLPEGFVIRPEHLAHACDVHGVAIQPGDAVLLHTGWGALWTADPQRYNAAEPGLGWEGAHWLTDRRVSLVGADNWGLEVMPFERDDYPFVVHQHLIAETGTYVLENTTTQEV